MSLDKTVAVSTFCSWASYGSMLQAYALKKTLKKVGYSSYILIDRTVVTPKNKCKIPITPNPVALFRGCINRLLLSDLTKQYQKNTQFMRDNIDIIYYNGYDELALNYLKADYYLAGSDQVFNPNNPQPGFYFDYVQDKSKLLTYACSMGVSNVASDREEVFKKRINNFKRISVRETDSISVLKKFNPDAVYQTNIDPTFLLTADEWRKKEKKYEIDGEYILLFPLYWDRSLNAQIKQLKKKSGVKIVCVCPSGFSTVACDKRLYDVGVDEFLWLIDNAQAVITSSFHGAAFATIFEKKVCLVINPNMPSRLEHLSNMLDIPKCEIGEVLSQKRDYEIVKSLIEKEREKSMLYLEEILNGK